MDCEVIDDDTGEVVGYAYGEEWDSDFCEAIVIIDPPSGSYWTHGNHSWSAIMHEKVISYTQPISYINPY